MVGSSITMWGNGAGLSEIRDCLADIDALNSCHSDNVARVGLVDINALEPAEGEQLGDLHFFK